MRCPVHERGSHCEICGSVGLGHSRGWVVMIVVVALLVISVAMGIS